MTTPPAASGDKLTKAIKAFSEQCQCHPEKKRLTILREIAFRFDLSPRECEFLETKFAQDVP